MKKDYISPRIFEFHYENNLMAAASRLDQNSDNPNVEVDENEVIDDGFASRRRNQWDDEEDDY